MKWRCLTLAACVILPVLAQEADPTPPDARRIQGAWEIVKGLKDGKPAPKDMLESVLTFDDKTITIKTARGGGERPATYKLDPKKTPAEIDITPVKDAPAPAGGGAPPVAPPAVLGIYKFEKDELTLMFSEPGGERPKAFDDKKASMLVLRPAKKEKK